MKNFITVLAALFVLGIGGLAGVYVYKKWFAEPPVSFSAESIKDISEFHTLKYNSTFNYYYYKNDNPTRTIQAIVEIPVNTSFYFDLDSSELLWEEGKLKSITIPDPVLRPLDFEIQNARNIPTNIFGIRIGRNIEAKIFNALPEICNRNIENVKKRILVLGLHERAKENFSVFLKGWVKNFQEEPFELDFVG